MGDLMDILRRYERTYEVSAPSHIISSLFLSKVGEDISGDMND